MGGEAAVPGVTGEQRRVAKVLARVEAIGAVAAGMAEPGHADARAELQTDAVAGRLDPADDLVAGDDRQLRVRQFAVDDMQIGAADAAGLDPHADLPRARLGFGPLLHREPLVDSPQNHGAHGGKSSIWRAQARPEIDLDEAPAPSGWAPTPNHANSLQGPPIVVLSVFNGLACYRNKNKRHYPRPGDATRIRRRCPTIWIGSSLGSSQ